MKPLLKIDTSTKVTSVAEAIATIFKVGQATDMDQSTICRALDVINYGCSDEIIIHDCQFIHKEEG